MTRYSAFDQELLAVYATNRHNLEGREFYVNTDHKPLTYVMNSTTERPSLRQTRHLAFITVFTTDIWYVKGEANFEVEALSRPTVSAIKYHAAINYKGLSADQALDTEFIRLRHSTSSNIKFRLLKTFDDVLVWCDILTGRSRPYVTNKLRTKVFTSRVRSPFS